MTEQRGRSMSIYEFSVCHEDSSHILKERVITQIRPYLSLGRTLNRIGLARWLASFTDLAAVIVIQEPRSRLWGRIKHEIRRIGYLRLLDVFAFRLYHRLFLAAADHEAFTRLMHRLEADYPPTPSSQIVFTASPNTPEIEKLLALIAPDLIIARCKHILRRAIFSQARTGTFVMHPGICPEYRNAHGCFWALERRDLERVGMTLLRVDPGVDTGPVFGYYRCNFDEKTESHNVIQDRVVFDNLDALRQKLLEIHAVWPKPSTLPGGNHASGASHGSLPTGVGSASPASPAELAMHVLALLYHDVTPAARNPPADSPAPTHPSTSFHSPTLSSILPPLPPRNITVSRGQGLQSCFLPHLASSLPSMMAAALHLRTSLPYWNATVGVAIFS